MPAVEDSAARSGHPDLSAIVRRFVAEAEAEEKLFELLADAVNRGNRDDAFLLARQLTKNLPAVSGHQQQISPMN